MEESSLRKVAIPIVLISFLMVGVSALRWYQDRHKVHTLTLATAGPTGEYYAFGQALSKVVAKHNPRIKINVITSEGSQQNVEWLTQQKVQLAIVQNDTPLNPSLETISVLFPEIFHLVVNESSGINRVKDLKGKKIALLPKGSGSYRLFWVLLQHYGLKESDLITSPQPLDEGINQLLTGKADGLFQVIALGNPKMMRDLLQNNQLKIVPIEQGAALRLFLPALEEAIIPKGTYNGARPIPKEDLATIGVRSLLITHNQVDSELIHEITRIIYENRGDLIQENMQAAMIPQADHFNHLGFSVHPGAEAYYNQDKPSFIVQYAEPISLGVSLAVLGVSGLWQLRMWLQGKQKNRADLYNLELIQLIREIDQAHSREELEEIREKLMIILEKVIIDLDKDKITPESFQSFTFPLNVGLTAIRHRELLLHRAC